MTSRENQVPHSRMVEMVLDGIADWVKKYRLAVDAGRELADCHPDEVKAIVNDIGMTPSDLRTLAGHKGPEPAAAELLKKMLVALKVDPKILDMLDPHITHDLKKSCITCGEKWRCRHELLAGTAVTNMGEYCSNAVTFNDLFEAVKSRNAEPH